MIKVNEDFLSRMQDFTDFKENAEIILTDGTVLELSEDDFTLSNNSVSDGAGISSIPLGIAVCKTVQLELMNDDDHLRKYNFIGAKIRLYITFYLENEEKNVIGDKDGDALATTEGLYKIIASSPYAKIEYGLFTVISPETYGTTVIITGYDDMYKANQTYQSNLVYPATAGAVLRDCCNSCGILLSTSEFKNSRIQITEKPSNEYTFRQVIGYIAMIAAGNARINRSGYLEVLTYDFDYSNGHNKLSEWINLKIDTDDIVITGISTEIEGENNEKTTLTEGDEGYILNVQNPLMAGAEQTLISMLGEKLIGVTFRKFEGDHVGYPLAEFMDLAKITDLNGNVYNTFVTDINFVFFGQTTIKNSAESGIRNSNSYQTPAQKALIAMRKNIEFEKTQREEAIKNLENTLKNGSGMYSTYEIEPDGSTITYIHDKKDLKESQNVIKITADAVGVSNDGGKTYPYGFVLTGELIAKLLSVEGINADYINSGAITISDSKGNEIFSVDIDTKKVYISGDNVQLSGKPLSDKIKEIENTADDAKKVAASAKNMSMQLSNEYQTIPVDSEGNYKTFPVVSTQVTAFYGNTDITNNCSYEIIKSDYVQGTWNDDTHTYTATALLSDTGWVDIKITYLNSLTLTRRFSLAKLYAGQRGLQGVQGEKGEQGVAGKDGVTGKTSYFHIKYSSVSNPTSSSQMKETPDIYIGTYVDFTETDSSDPKKYIWSQFRGSQGEKGDQGIPGIGEDGKTSYLHIAYANSSDGKTGFSASDSANKLYIGQYTDFTKSDSTDPEKYSWSRLKGDDGIAGRTYFIESSVNALKRSKDNTILPELITFSAYYRDGNSTSRTNYSGRFIIEETSDGNNWKALYTSSVNESSLTKTFSNLGVSSNATSIRCKLYASGGTSQLLDMQSCVILVDIDNLTQQEIFNILTDNGNKKGLYMSGNELYINASYIVAGILADKNKNSYWDLDKGELVTKLAKIGGWNVDSKAIYKDVTAEDGAVYRVYFQPPIQGLETGTWVLSCQKANAAGKGFTGLFKLLSNGDAKFGDNYINSDGTFKIGSMQSYEVDGTIYTQFSNDTNDEYLILAKKVYYNTGYSTDEWAFYLHDSDTERKTCLDFIGPKDWIDSPIIRCDSVKNYHDYEITHYFYEVFNETIDFEKSISVAGNLYVSGSKSRSVNTKNYDKRNLYCYEMPSPYFGDIGEGILDESGKCIIIIDDIFSETITTKMSYQVFLQKEGQGDIWVEKKENNYFEIAGTPGLSFAWELKARQKDFDFERLEKNENDSTFNDIDYEAEAAAMVKEFYNNLEVMK